jgi:membrane-associated HD superfamily phosphohydrolase
MEAGNGEDISEEQFRYGGPKPHNKETAIVMLADSVEAAVRSMSQPTPQKVEQLIKKITRDKLNDGQLDDCNLTLKDLDEIGRVFVKVLSGIFHSRVEYPEVQQTDTTKDKV